MARPLRLEYPGAVYHVTSRGNAREKIFINDTDKLDFQEIVGIVIKRFNWLIHSYCLMDNHYHLLVETPEGNLSRGMRQLNGVYTQRFNIRHGRVGHVFQGRFKAIVVDKDNYLLELCRYIVLNPVRAEIVESPEDWPWSSYREIISEEKKKSWVTTDWVLRQFGKRRKEAIKGYEKFVLEGMKGENPLDQVKGKFILGDSFFIEKMKKILGDKDKVQEITREQRYVSQPALKDLFLGVSGKSKDLAARDRIAYEAYARYGYKLREIAEHLNVHYATISRAVKKGDAI